MSLTELSEHASLTTSVNSQNSYEVGESVIFQCRLENGLISNWLNRFNGQNRLNGPTGSTGSTGKKPLC